MQRENKVEIFPHWLYQIYREPAWVSVRKFTDTLLDYILNFLFFHHPIKPPPSDIFIFILSVKSRSDATIISWFLYPPFHSYSKPLSVLQYHKMIFLFLSWFIPSWKIYVHNKFWVTFLILKEWIHYTLSLKVCFVFGALKQKLVKAGGGFKFKCEFIAVLKMPQRRFMSCLNEQHICIKTKKQSYELWVLFLAIFKSSPPCFYHDAINKLQFGIPCFDIWKFPGLEAEFKRREVYETIRLGNLLLCHSGSISESGY